MYGFQASSPYPSHALGHVEKKYKNLQKKISGRVETNVDKTKLKRYKFYIELTMKTLKGRGRVRKKCKKKKSRNKDTLE